MMNSQAENEILVEFIHLFAAKDRKERYVSKLVSPKANAAPQLGLMHAMEFDPRFITELPQKRIKPEDVYTLMKSKGAEDQAFMVTAQDGLKGCILPLKEALASCVNSCFGTIVYCPEGRVAYYEGDGDVHVVLHKAS